MVILRSDTLTVALCAFGARMTGLWYRDYAHSLVLGAPHEADFAGDLMYFGALIGPVANRISGACIRIGESSWQMEANEGHNCLHSGNQGLHALTWPITDQSAQHVTFEITVEHGHCGLPGNRTFKAIYRIEGASLRLDITATTDRTTPVNIAHHPYWNLSGEPSVAAHMLRTAAHTYLPVDGATCPTGDVAPVADTPYDFRRPRAVPTDITLDANLCLAHARYATPRFAARLSAPQAPELEIATTEAGLQVYNGTGLTATQVHLHRGQKLDRCAGIALEPQGWPDAPSHAGFPDIWCDAGAQYRQTTIYSFT
jgi:aldose 1-epimerase